MNTFAMVDGNYNNETVYFDDKAEAVEFFESRRDCYRIAYRANVRLLQYVDVTDDVTVKIGA
jgi:hypothetical protein